MSITGLTRGKIFASLCFALAGVLSLSGQTLPSSARYAVDSMIRRELANKAFPGAAFVTGDANSIHYAQNYGNLDYTHHQNVSDSTLYDIASCTKVLSTTFVLMRLYDEHKIRLQQTLADFLPRFADTPAASVTVQELLTHTSGFRSQVFYPLLVQPSGGTKLFSSQRSEQYPYLVDKNLYMIREVALDSTYLSSQPHPDYRQVTDSQYINPAIDTLIVRKIINGYDPARRGRYLYNDVNMYLLKLIAERITGESLETLTAELFAKLECRDTGYRPLEWATPERIAPTEEDKLLRRGMLRGYVHDELAALAGGAASNAGLFSTARDMARFCQLILNDGVYDGRQIISKATIDLFTSSPLASEGIYRGLGFDKRSEASSAFGGASSSGHTGFTGTIFWLDRDKKFFMVFLSNSIHPTRTNRQLSSSQLRLNIWKALKAAHP